MGWLFIFLSWPVWAALLVMGVAVCIGVVSIAFSVLLALVQIAWALACAGCGALFGTKSLH